MWSYNTNYMGPMMHWYERSKIPYTMKTSYSKLFEKEITVKVYQDDYAGGRIDCYCSNPDDPDFNPYGEELGLPIMKLKSYGLFSEFLDGFHSSSLMSFEELKELYEERYEKLEIWEDE